MAPMLEGALVHVSGPRDVTTLGALLALGLNEDVGIGWFTYAWRLDAALGTGSGGLEMRYAGDLLLGLRAYVTDHQGPLVRIGLISRSDSNDIVDATIVAPLSGEVGYEYVDGDMLFEIVARGGYATNGTWSTAGATQRALDGSTLVGASAWLVSRPMSVRVEWWRDLPSAGASFDTASASTCGGLGWTGQPGESLQWQLCGLISSYSGFLSAPGAQAPLQASGASASLMVGLGRAASWQHVQ